MKVPKKRLDKSSYGWITLWTVPRGTAVRGSKVGVEGSSHNSLTLSEIFRVC